jgi:hypothetical protein
MTLIIEDGTGVDNANSYVTDAEYVAFAAARGRTIGVDAPAREKELILAMDFVESHRSQFQGIKILSTQSLQYPRTPVYIDSYLFPSNEIPVELKNSQMESAAIVNSESLLKTGSTKNVQSESVAGAVSRSYFNGGKWETVRMDTVNIFLRPLLNFGSFGVNARVIRS